MRRDGVVRGGRRDHHPRMIVRPYRPDDVDALYDICLRTGAAGEDASAQYQDPRLLGEIYVGPYLRLEPELAFVVDDGRPVGYVVGTRDTRSFEAACEREWWPALRERYPAGTFPAESADARLIELIHRPIAADHDVVAGYPSHLHIDLLPAAQGRGLGRVLMERLFETLRAAGSPGVHLGVGRSNDRAIGFYQRLGFEIFRRQRRSLIMARPLRGPE